MKEYKIKLELIGNFEDDWDEKKIKEYFKFFILNYMGFKGDSSIEIKESNKDNPYHIDHKRQTKIDF